jgi:hypothetical protein
VKTKRLIAKGVGRQIRQIQVSGRVCRSFNQACADQELDLRVQDADAPPFAKIMAAAQEASQEFVSGAPVCTAESR